jgi:hypothetical protein
MKAWYWAGDSGSSSAWWMATWKAVNSALGSVSDSEPRLGCDWARSWVLTKDPCSVFHWETRLEMMTDPRWEMRWDCQRAPHWVKRTVLCLVFD